MGFLFGSKGGYPGWMKDQGRSLIDSWDTYADDLYSPESYRRDVSRFSNDMQSNMDNWGQGMNLNLASRGFSGTVNGVSPFMTQLAQFMSNRRRQNQEGRLNSLQGKAGLISQMSPLFYKQPSGGLIPSLASAAGFFAGSKKPAQQPTYQNNSGVGYNWLNNARLPMQQLNPYG